MVQIVWSTGAVPHDSKRSGGQEKCEDGAGQYARWDYLMA